MSDSPRRKIPITVAVLLTSAVLVLGGCSDTSRAQPDPGGPSPATNGPVTFGDNANTLESSFGILADAGEQVVFGGTSVRNDGADDAVLTGAGIYADSSATYGARVSQVRVLDLTTYPNATFIGAGRWPIKKYLERSEPLAGFTLAPGAAAELLLVITVEETGTWDWPTTVVEYDTPAGSFRDETKTGFMICPAAANDCGH